MTKVPEKGNKFHQGMKAEYCETDMGKLTELDRSASTANTKPRQVAVFVCMAPLGEKSPHMPIRAFAERVVTAPS
jgi:hypothetical protein